jgi:hypothetical protein
VLSSDDSVTVYGSLLAHCVFENKVINELIVERIPYRPSSVHQLLGCSAAWLIVTFATQRPMVQIHSGK